jgi:uncharacterized lipoprotein YddW (UPF0748 family)
MSLLRRLTLPVVFAVAGLPNAACGQLPPFRPSAAETSPPPIPREFRAVWVATVGNMDWPSRPGLTTAEQQAELLAILDKLVQLRMNAIVLQVRPAADALYESRLEPWSDVLTGEMGRAPEPYYDPLAFAVGEAHKRGLELHAWINPYRAMHPATKTMAPSHISRAHPELVREYGPFLWMDPGDPQVRAHTRNVVLDLVRRYDIDGVHMDDYFYPYPEARNGRELDFPDEPTWHRYVRSGGTLARDDWRRQNVDLLVKELGDSIHAVKSWVRFGVSPFGIWRPGNPESVRGFDQYAKLYADARKWLREGWVDYFTPQLYWAVSRPEQSYPVLLKWWAEQNVKGRHLWPGNYTGKVAFTTASAWRTDEVLEQIRLTRAQPGATGNVHFSMKVFQQNPDNLDERLGREAYTGPAVVPASPWLDGRVPARPQIALRTDSLARAWVLDLRAGIDPADSVRTADGYVGFVERAPWLWIVQTWAGGGSGWTTMVLPGSTRRHVLGTWGGGAPVEVRVTAVSRVGNASPTARVTQGP